MMKIIDNRGEYTTVAIKDVEPCEVFTVRDGNNKTFYLMLANEKYLNLSTMHIHHVKDARTDKCAVVHSAAMVITNG